MTRDGMPGLRTFLASFLVLFLEVALIRWMPAYIRLLAYFSNFILLASFLGIGVGCLLASVAGRLFRWFPALQAAVILAVYYFRLEISVPTAGSIYFSSGTVRQERRAGREHDAAAAALPRRRGAVRDAGAADGDGDGGAAAAARLHLQHRRQPGRRGGVRAHLLAAAVAGLVVRAGVRLRGAAARLAGARGRRRAGAGLDGSATAARRWQSCVNLAHARGLAGASSRSMARGRDLVAVLQDHRRQTTAPTPWWR